MKTEKEVQEMLEKLKQEQVKTLKEGSATKSKASQKGEKDDKG